MISKPKILKQNLKLVEKSDNDGQTVKVAEAQGGWIDENTFKNADGTLSSRDPNMVMREIHNQSGEPLYFKKMNPSMMGADTIMINDDKFSVIPHAYYTVSTKSGKPCKFAQYFGSAMFQHKRSILP